MADIGTGTSDSNGIQRLKSNQILFAKFVDVSISSFANPDSSFYGYASDGFYREAGIAVASPSTGQPAKASWASEAEHTTVTDDRNLEDPFPPKIFVILTSEDLVILNANTLTVWMRFDLSPSSGISNHYFLGGPTSASTVLLDADFSDGVLCVTQTDSVTATSNGVIIADFRRDEMLRTTANATSAKGIKSPKTLSQRNTTGVWQSTTLTTADFSLVESGCNNISVLTSNNQTYIATSHDSGISILRLKPGSSGYALMQESRQLFETSYTGTNYRAVDDLDGDATTPTFDADNRAEWASDGIREGDILVVSGNRYRISSVGTELTLSDEISTSISVSGGNYEIVRPVSHLLFHTLGSLIFASGEGFLIQQQDQTYQTSPNSIEPWDAPDYQASIPSSEVNDFAIRGSDLYVATDSGIYRTQLTDDSDGLPTTLDYTDASGSGLYKVLSHDKTTALSVDPETGHLVFATYSGSAAEVVDLDVDNLHQVVKRTSSNQEIRSIASYKNPDGPPSVSVS